MSPQLRRPADARPGRRASADRAERVRAASIEEAEPPLPTPLRDEDSSRPRMIGSASKLRRDSTEVDSPTAPRGVRFARQASTERSSRRGRRAPHAVRSRRRRDLDRPARRGSPAAIATAARARLLRSRTSSSLVAADGGGGGGGGALAAPAANDRGRHGARRRRRRCRRRRAFADGDAAGAMFGKLNINGPCASLPPSARSWASAPRKGDPPNPREEAGGPDGRRLRRWAKQIRFQDAEVQRR